MPPSPQAPPALAHRCGTDRLGRKQCVRNQSVQVMAERFVEEAHWLGAGPGWILRRCLLQPCLLHSCLLRRVIPSVPVPPTLNAADALVVLGLSFLGEGRRCCHTRQRRLKF